MRQTLEGSFSSVSKPDFASKYAFESSRRDLHNALLCAALHSQFLHLQQKKGANFWPIIIFSRIRGTQFSHPLPRIEFAAISMGLRGEEVPAVPDPGLRALEHRGLRELREEHEARARVVPERHRLYFLKALTKRTRKRKRASQKLARFRRFAKGSPPMMEFNSLKF